MDEYRDSAGLKGLIFVDVIWFDHPTGQCFHSVSSTGDDGEESYGKVAAAGLNELNEVVWKMMVKYHELFPYAFRLR